MFVFGNFNVHHKDWLTYLADSVIIFLSQTTLLRWLTFVLYVSVSINFPSNSERDIPFHRTAYDYSRANWDNLRDNLRDVPREDIFKLGTSAPAAKFCEYISFIINIRSSLIHLHDF